MSVRSGERVRVTAAEYVALREAAEARGQGHTMPASITTRGDLLQAHAAAAGSLLMDVLCDPDSPASRAYREGRITMMEILAETADPSSP